MSLVITTEGKIRSKMGFVVLTRKILFVGKDEDWNPRVVWASCGSGKFHFGLFESFSVARINYEYNAVGASGV